MQVALRVMQHGRNLRDGLRRRRIRDEMPDEFCRQQIISRPVGGQIPQRRHAGILAAVKALAHHRLRPRLMRVRAVQEPGGITPLVAGGDTPPSENLRHTRHIRLRVARGEADRVQLHAFAAQVLVQAALLALAGRAGRAEGGIVVEIAQHRWVAFHR